MSLITSMVNLIGYLFSSSRYSLLSMIEGGWLKWPSNRKFRRLRTADEEKTLLEKSVPKGTLFLSV